MTKKGWNLRWNQPVCDHHLLNKMLYEIKQIHRSIQEVWFQKYLYILCPGGSSKAKLYKRGSCTPLNKLPLKQSHFKWTLSTPVILMDFKVPGINWMNPFGGSFKGAEYD